MHYAILCDAVMMMMIKQTSTLYIYKVGVELKKILHRMKHIMNSQNANFRKLSVEVYQWMQCMHSFITNQMK